MTRRRRHAGGAGAAQGGDAENEDKNERIAVFEKTKMCKFHILGVCMKGDNCRFAHDKCQLQALPDLQRTKLCKTLINTGQCDNPQCKYAHNKEELRPLPEVDPATKDMRDRERQGQPAQVGGLPPQGTDPTVLAAFSGFNPASGGQSAQQAQAAQEAAALFRPGGPLAQYGQPLQDMPMNQKQAAIQQMGQVAQAHAAEAARLHAMAMFLHAHANGQGGPVPDQAALAQMVNQGLPQDKPSNASSAPTGGDGAQGSSGKSQQDYARVGSANSADDGDMAATMRRVLSSEPVQINPNSLRSMSSCSLQGLGGNEEEKEELPGDVEDLGQSPSTGNAKHVLTYAGSQTPSPDRRNSGSSAAGNNPKHDAAAALAQAFTSVNDVMTVKNTFLDFGPHTPVSQVLRSVQTASGRLDLMSQE